MTEPDLEHAGVDIRKLLPSTRRRSEPTRWEVSIDEKVVGWIDCHTIHGAAATFYFATGIHPHSGKEYRLEGSTDFHERVEVLRRFHEDPMTSRQHLGIGRTPG